MEPMDTNYAAPGRSTGGDEGVAVRSRLIPWLRAGFVIAVLLQGYLLYVDVPGTSDVVLFPHIDKVVHAALFALPAVIGVLAGVPPWALGVVLAGHAPVSELIQHVFLPGRFGDPLDVVADLVGVGLGLAVGVLVLRLWQRRVWERAL